MTFPVTNRTFWLPAGRSRAGFPTEQGSECCSACGDPCNEPAGAWLWWLYSSSFRRVVGSGHGWELSGHSWS